MRDARARTLLTSEFVRLDAAECAALEGLGLGGAEPRIDSNVVAVTFAHSLYLCARPFCSSCLCSSAPSVFLALAPCRRRCPATPTLRLERWKRPAVPLNQHNQSMLQQRILRLTKWHCDDNRRSSPNKHAKPLPRTLPLPQHPSPLMTQHRMWLLSGRWQCCLRRFVCAS